MKCSDCMFFEPAQNDFFFSRNLPTCAMGVELYQIDGGFGAFPGPPYNPAIERGQVHYDSRWVTARVCPNFQPAGGYGGYSEGNQSSGSNSSGCFLTSACVDALGKEDDCYELETLRRFRDEWLALQEGGEQDIARYYAFAPGVVRQIDRLPDRMSLYARIYDELVAPCVRLIEAHKMQEAWDLYKSYAGTLIGQYGECAA